MAYLAFARQNARPLLFGLLHSFYSAPGQTYVIGLFAASMAATIGVGPAEIGGLYLAATLGSAFTLIFVGHWIDHVRLVHFSAAVVIGLACACFVTALATGPLVLFVAFYLLQLTGQGLMSHVEATATARTFDAERGRALGITALGIPLSIVVFPPLAIAGIEAIGWQATYAGLGAGALFVIFPVTQWLLRTFKRAPPGMTRPEGARRSLFAGLRELLRSRHFRLIVPALAIFPFHMTGVMFHIVTIAEDKGWSPTVVAASYPVMAAASVTGLFLSGWLIDRFSARKLFPMVPLPLLGGIALMAFASPAAIVPVAFALLGLADGFARTTTNAIWAELFGVATLGAIRSAAVMYMVFMSGLSPFVLGLALQSGMSVPAILWSLVGAGLVLLIPAAMSTRL
jgi:MFS family permease